MHIVVSVANEEQKEMFLQKNLPNQIRITYGNKSIEGANAYFFLDFNGEDFRSFSDVINTPIFVNSVNTTSDSLPNNCIRINGWFGFFNTPKIEVVYKTEQQKIVDEIFNQLQWQYTKVPDIIGMIAPRIVCSIINEAYFALEENVSTEQQIDIAMKLGTNYPFGPFEWAKKIGLQQVYNLLLKLSITDDRYTPCTLLEKNITT